MTLLRKLVSVACWACLLTSYSASTNSQTPDPTTGNLVNFTGTPTATTGNWVNGVYTNTICFHAGDPGNCGPYPSVQRTGNINFSYGGVNLYQVVNIQQALKAAGNNLQVTGFNFGFMAKNGNGWDDGRQDYLNAYVQFYRPDGGVAALYGYSQYTNRKYDWTNFNFSETFANPSLATSYRAAQYGFIGRDNNYWAGNYGPEITNVSFNLKYRVDPCATDPTSSPACPGFAAAMNAKKTTLTPVDTSTPSLETSIVIVPIVTSTTQTKTDTALPPVKPQSKILALALSLISKNQQQEQALQTSVAQAAIAEATNAADKAQQQAVSVAASLTTMSQQPINSSMPTNSNSPITDNKPTTVTLSPVSAPKVTTSSTSSVSVSSSTPTVDIQPVTTTSLQSYFTRASSTVTQVDQGSASNALPPQPPNNQSRTAVATQPTITTVTPTQNTSVFSQPTIEYQQTNIVTAYVQPQNTMFYTMVSNTITEQPQQTMAQPISLSKQAEIEQVNNTVSFMANRTDPLNDIVEAKPTVTTTSTTESTQTVKAKVTDNELAGGVDINKMAILPVGYNNYTNLMLKDGKMYEPKEIYKNQVPVDNARALRQLSTDRLHQQMIEQQYRR
jgi:hypothetical protein